MKALTGVLACAIAILGGFVGARSLPAESKATITGVVVSNPGGKPVPGALVTSLSGRARAKTDALGRFELEERTPRVRVRVSAADHVTRETGIESNGPGTEVIVDLIESRTPFSQQIFNDVARAHRGSGRAVIGRWNQQEIALQIDPRVRTIATDIVPDDHGPVDADLVRNVRKMIEEAIPMWTGGRCHLGKVEERREQCPAQALTGSICVTFGLPADQAHALSGFGAFNVDGQWGKVTFNVGVTRAGEIAPQLVAHELGHALGFQHTRSLDSVMCADLQVGPVPLVPDGDRLIGAIVYSRPNGNWANDVDPDSFVIRGTSRTTTAALSTTSTSRRVF